MKATKLDADLDRFVARLRARLAAGAVTYDESLFVRPPPDLLDVGGWSLGLWLRPDRLGSRVAQIHDGGRA